MQRDEKTFQQSFINRNNPSYRVDLLKRIKTYRVLLFMILPGIIYFIVFHYIPMYGVTIAFKDFMILEGIIKSPWVGFKYFERAFQDPGFLSALKNTLVISLLKMIFGFPAPIIFALLLNEVAHEKYKKTVQTISYLPHFISWVVLAGIFINIFSIDGPINALIKMLGGTPKIFMADPISFLIIIIVTDVWKGFGWGAIIYLAALSGLDIEVYEAAIVDGASRFKRVIYITIPSLTSVIVIMLILRTASILNAGFDQIFNMYNPTVLGVAEVLDTYVYKKGLEQMEYSYSTAVGLFKSVVCLIMMFITNAITNKIGGKGYGLW